jgi:hypothetical protein
MTTPAQHEEDRRRRGLLVLLLAAILLLLLGFLGGYLVLGPDTSGAAQATPTSLHVPPGVLPVESPSGVPAVLDGTGQAVTEAAGVGTRAATGHGEAVSRMGLPLVVASKVVGRVGPGTPATLVITVTNPDTSGVVLTGATARITSVTSAASTTGPACSPGWYAVGTFSGVRPLGPLASTTVELRITFDDSRSVNQDSCKSARYAYAYRVEARKP